MEAFVASLAGILGIFTWTHEQRQRVTDKRFENIKKRLELVEEKIEKLPIDYVLKKDLNNDLHEIRTWLRSINDKIDTLILSRS
jgi:pyruvate-formate lyase-activating enzyme